MCIDIVLHWLLSNWLQPNLDLCHSAVLKQLSFEMVSLFFSLVGLFG